MPARNEISRGKRQVDAFAFPRTEPAEQVDVLVVGAGPNGLGAALELHRHGVQAAVVDAASGATLVRAGAAGYTSRALEVIRGWGLLQRIQHEWTFPPEWSTGNLLLTSLAGHQLAGTTLRSFGFGAASRYSTETMLRRPQTVLQRVFLDRLAEIGTTVSGGWRVEGLASYPDGVTTTVVEVETGRRRTIRSRYVVGADGGKSTVRTLAGIGRSGSYADERYFRFVVRTTSDTSSVLGAFPPATAVIYNDRYSGFLAALNETDWRAYAGPYPLDRDPTTDELIAQARAAFGFDVELEVVSLTPFFKSTRIADTFYRDRIALVGDAAHVRTPGGNLCEGFGDVVNLGWKLAAVLRGQAGPSLLDSYDEERRPHNWRIADYALAEDRRHTAAYERVRALGVPADADTSPDAARRRAEIGAILGAGRSLPLGVVFDERYDTSSVIRYEDGQAEAEAAAPWDAFAYDDDARPGHRAPNGNLDPFGFTLYDRIGSHIALLVLAADNPGTVAAFEAAADARGLELEVIHLPDPAARELYGAPYALVRPDHHVAWRGDGSDLDAGAVLDLVYGRGQAAAQPPAQTRSAGSRQLVDLAER
ncbi:FAD-dependent monooxygenase [Frankia tisae]|uniref:FAD-dependent monooxygenase n=1 Tax=Frankia tisae TaxID=2950104 RepID=UPI0021BFFAB8|nr:FAD-dependent monooxygenase [Frankia tisae]